MSDYEWKPDIGQVVAGYFYEPPGEGCHGCKSLAKRLAETETKLEAAEKRIRNLRLTCKDYEDMIESLEDKLKLRSESDDS